MQNDRVLKLLFSTSTHTGTLSGLKKIIEGTEEKYFSNNQIKQFGHK